MARPKGSWKFILKNYLQSEKGSKHVNAKLTEKQVVVIKQKLMSKISMDSIAKEFDVNKNPIYDIASNKNWIYVKVEGWSEYQAERSKGRITNVQAMGWLSLVKRRNYKRTFS
ncbi:hypothetical protein BK767_26300 [Bacillus thuringiensis serovar kyushuensis]|uniref:hypothetical protein n=1 Tax=Bacillus thuringiensis TaxID=1428 RepID=UPI000B43DCDA|nr:hypothetical protein [Bacillus thuringiensis]MEC2861584.1 hypothetical protein [Bacillus cereus]OTZ63544.1 hypothetical protein BK767_26300 [Bacillus thuringiensis serovar kyushuensis]OTZ73987.1 hypothetical protein BK768_14720 [Bacillus thuringiensis serovar tohokuensis]OUB82663.1 hypothetical protein BK773_25875 [Bacillus thuringiensis serovar indiana]